MVGKVVGIVAAVALILGLCLSSWPCEEGFSGRGVGNCEDINECKEGAFLCEIFQISFSRI